MNREDSLRSYINCSSLATYVKSLGSNIDFHAEKCFDIIKATVKTKTNNLVSGKLTNNPQPPDSFDDENGLSGIDKDSSSATHSSFSLSKYLHSMTTEGSIKARNESSIAGDVNN